MITEYPIEDLIIISGAREQKKRKPAYSKGNVGASKNVIKHFLRRDYLYLCYRLAFFSSVSAKLNQKISHICQVQSDADNSFEF